MRTSFTGHATSMVITLAVMIGAAGVVAQQTPPLAQQQPVPAAPAGPPFPSVPPLPFPDGSQIFDTLAGPIRVSPLAKGLVNPWSLTFLPDGNMLVTEKPGRLRMVRNGALVAQPIPGVPAVFAGGQGGLMEVLLHPRFSDNRLIYLTYSKPGERGATTALARARFDGTELSNVRDIFVAENWGLGSDHFGSRLAFGRDGMLYMTVGERNDRRRAQDMNLHGGKVLRLKDDGTVPPDNPFVGRSGIRPEIYSYGHRNLQGLAFHPTTGGLWETEHGPQGGDELNMILPGKNYGWPIVTLGREYTGEVISHQPAREGIEQPVTVLGAVDRSFRADDLHGRSLSGVEREISSWAASRGCSFSAWRLPIVAPLVANRFSLRSGCAFVTFARAPMGICTWRSTPTPAGSFASSLRRERGAPSGDEGHERIC